MLAGGVHEDEKVLEPSAGTGAIIDAIHRSCPDVIVDCYELMPENKEILAKRIIYVFLEMTSRSVILHSMIRL